MKIVFRLFTANYILAVLILPYISLAQTSSANLSGLNTNVGGFIENKGQVTDQFHHANSSVKYLLQEAGMNVQLKSNGFSYDTYEILSDVKQSKSKINFLKNDFPKDSTKYRFHRVDIDFPGSNISPLISTSGKSAAYTLFYGPGRNEPIRAYHYHQIIYQNLYAGIDLVFNTSDSKNKRPFEYHFIVHPNADANKIKMVYKGAESSLQNNKIRIVVRKGIMEETIPASFITDNINPQIKSLQQYSQIKVRYKQIAKGAYGFSIPVYNKSKTLIIDPTPDLIWGTYYGSTNNDWAYCISRNTDGSLIVGGASDNPNLATAGTYQSIFGGFDDGMLGKFASNGQLLWMTYYGGDQTEFITGNCIDNAGNIYVSGFTDSKSGIATPGAFQTFNGENVTPFPSRDGFIVKFDPSGMRVWGTFFGGDQSDQFYNIKVDVAGNLFLAGTTSSTNGISSPGAFQTNYGSDADPQHAVDGMLAKFDNNGNRIWSTYYGGNNYDGLFDICLDSKGQVYATGVSRSAGISTNNAFQSNLAGNNDVLLVSFDTDGTRRWATYYGGTDFEFALAITCDLSNNIILGGETVSPSGFGTPGTYQPTFQGDQDGFIAKFNDAGNRIWGTYIGGAGQEEVRGITTDLNNDIIITGAGNSKSQVATANSYQPVFPSQRGYGIPFIEKFSTSGALIWGTYYGKSGIAEGNGYGEDVVTDPEGNVFVCGETLASEGISTCGATQPNWAGNFDMYISMFSETIKPLFVSSIVTSNTSGAVCPGTVVQFSATAINGGNNPTYQWKVNGNNAGTNSNVFSATALAQGDKVSCTVTSNSPCITNPVAVSNEITVAISPAVQPGISISRSPTDKICTGTAETFTAAPSNGGPNPSYQWILNGVTKVGTNNPVFTTNTLKDGDVITCQITNAQACVPNPSTISNELNIIVAATVIPTISIQSQNVVACAGTNIEFTTTVNNAGTQPKYQWLVNGRIAGTQSTFSSATLNDKDTVQCIVDPGNTGCALAGVIGSNKIGVQINALPNLTIVPDKPVITKGDSIMLIASGTGIVTYNWSPSTQISNILVANPMVWPSQTQIYTVEAKTAFGCTATKSIKVGVLSVLKIPNAFTPNNDAINDYWIIKGLDLYPNCTVTVFNRWGQQVFHSVGYGKPWDGRMNNKDLPFATYVYIIDLKDGTKPLKGGVTIIK